MSLLSNCPVCALIGNVGPKQDLFVFQDGDHQQVILSFLPFIFIYRCNYSFSKINFTVPYEHVGFPRLNSSSCDSQPFIMNIDMFCFV